MGRAPCCDKANVKKGPWAPEEDAKLKSYIEQNGTGGNWIALPQKIGLKRCGKSCRLRWLNYLRPNIKHGGFSEEEDRIICNLYISIGSRWSIIAAQLPGRTDNDIKNYWNTRLKKKLLGKQQRKQQQTRRDNNSCLRKGLLRKRSENINVVNSIVSGTNYNNQVQYYWPDQPVLAPSIPYSNDQEPSFNDHTSIRKLLIKLGGKFSDDDDCPIQGSTMSLQFPRMDLPSPRQLYGPSEDVSKASAPQLMNTHEFNIEEPGMSMLSDQSNFQPGFEEMVLYNNSNNPPRVDGMEFLYGNVVGDNRTETCSGELSMEWLCELSSNLSYPPMINPNYELGLQQGLLQEGTFDELRYAGMP